MVCEQDKIPYETSTLVGNKVLVIAPHADDEVLGCGGSLVKHVQHGDPVKVVVVTKDGPALCGRRRGECLRALGYLRIRDYEFLDFDERVFLEHEFKDRIRNILITYEPALIYLPAASELHPDHRFASALTAEVAKSLNACASTRLAFYEVSAPLKAVSLLVDITKEWRRKEKAIGFYKSQLRSNDYLRKVKGLNRYRTYTLPKAVKYAEAFYVLDIDHSGSGEKPDGRQPEASRRLAAWPLRSGGGAQPLVSIVIRTKNRPHLLKRAIRSVIDQTYPSIEIIVINDGGVPVERVLGELPKKRPIIYKRLPRSEGRSQAANAGIGLAGGYYLGFLDDDDILYRNHIELLADALSKTGHKLAYSNCAVVRGVFDDDRKEFVSISNERCYSEPFNYDNLCIENYIPMHSFLVERTVVAETGGFDPKLQYHEDWDLLLRVGARHLFHYVPVTTCEYTLWNSNGVRPDSRRPVTESYLYLVRKNFNDEWPKLLLGLWRRAFQVKREAEVKVEKAIKERDEYIAGHRLGCIISDLLANQALLLKRLSWRLTRLMPKRFYSGLLRNTKQSPPSAAFYQQWVDEHLAGFSNSSEHRAELAKWEEKPLLSLILVLNEPDRHRLREAIQSVLFQTYETWELIVVWDAHAPSRVDELIRAWGNMLSGLDCVRFIKHDFDHAQLNAYARGVLEAKGCFFALLGQDDLLEPNALFDMACAMRAFQDHRVFYSDELIVDVNGRVIGAAFRPDFSLDFLLSRDFIKHLVFFERALALKLGNFGGSYKIACQYELLLRAAETEQFFHVSKVLYRWRVFRRRNERINYADVHSESQRAVESYLQRKCINASVEKGQASGFLRVRRRIEESVKVSVIILTRDKMNLLKAAVESVVRKAKRHLLIQFEILVVDNGSVERRSLKYFDRLKTQGHIILPTPEPFNFSRLNNQAVQKSSGELLLFLNNDVRAISPDWLEALVEQALRPEVGAVGAQLLYPNGRVQHAGVFVGSSHPSGAEHHFRFMDSAHSDPFLKARLSRDRSLRAGPLGSLFSIRDYSAVSGACLMMRRSVFDEIDGFDEHFEVGLSDIDLCLRLIRKGYKVIYTPYALLHHKECATRGYVFNDDPHKADTALFQFKWPQYFENGDPFFPRGLSPRESDSVPGNMTRGLIEPLVLAK